MDSISHTRVARLLMDYVQETCGVSFDEAAFFYGNLKPDLKGTYLTKRHYPSLMYDEVIEKLRVFVEKYRIGPENGRELSVDLGEICHYMTDFFCYPHNDDIYDHNLLAHYIYEKRIALTIKRKLTEEKFETWAGYVIPPFSFEALVNRIGDLHARYKTQTVHHCIDNDLVYICQVVSTLVLAVINLTYEAVGEPVAALA